MLLRLPAPHAAALAVALSLGACTEGTVGGRGGAAAGDGPPAVAGARRDASAPRADGSPPRPDASAPRSDAGAPRPDAGAPRPDASAPRPDAGAPRPDAGAGPAVGGTITFQGLGAPGSYPSRRDPAVGPCDAWSTASCCLTRHAIAGDALTPWDEELVMTLRGPLEAEALAVYQPGTPARWQRVASWRRQDPGATRGLAFAATDGARADFSGTLGSECLLNVSTDRRFACGPGSVPYCPAPPGGADAHEGFAGSKLFILLARMPHAGELGASCATAGSGNWYDAPWIGLSVGELVRAGQFSGCHCYAQDPTRWALADGCGQLNAFEVVNDNGAYRNLDVFSTNFFGYAGYVGEGPCGPACDVGGLDPDVDLVDRSGRPAPSGAVASPAGGPGAALRRPTAGLRYFLLLLDVPTRTVQLALLHPDRLPPEASALLPALPDGIPRATVDALVALRLPR